MQVCEGLYYVSFSREKGMISSKIHKELELMEHLKQQKQFGKCIVQSCLYLLTKRALQVYNRLLVYTQKPMLGKVRAYFCLVV